MRVVTRGGFGWARRAGGAAAARENAIRVNRSIDRLCAYEQDRETHQWRLNEALAEQETGRGCSARVIEAGDGEKRSTERTAVSCLICGSFGSRRCHEKEIGFIRRSQASGCVC